MAIALLKKMIFEKEGRFYEDVIERRTMKIII
jgi:hypothetical protein